MTLGIVSIFKSTFPRKKPNRAFKQQNARSNWFIALSLLNYVPLFPSHLTFVYVRLPCFTCLCALRALLTRLTYAPCASFSRALHALFVQVKIFSDQFLVHQNLTIFQELLKALLTVLLLSELKKNSCETF